jgi:hypothetical protein
LTKEARIHSHPSDKSAVRPFHGFAPCDSARSLDQKKSRRTISVTAAGRVTARKSRPRLRSARCSRTNGNSSSRQELELTKQVKVSAQGKKLSPCRYISFSLQETGTTFIAKKGIANYDFQ